LVIHTASEIKKYKYRKNISNCSKGELVKFDLPLKEISLISAKYILTKERMSKNS